MIATASTLVPLPDLGGQDRIVFSHDNHDYLVWARPDGLVVTDALCPHKGVPLTGGVVRDGAVVCPGHFYAFDLGTGRCRTADRLRLAVYSVERVDGVAQARLPVGAPPTLVERLRALLGWGP